MRVPVPARAQPFGGALRRALLRVLGAALRDFPSRDAVSVRWRAFELAPRAPRERDRAQSYAGRLASKYGASERQAQAMIDRMVVGFTNRVMQVRAATED